MRVLYVIPARGGSKGIPRKNIKLLGTKPLIYYSIEAARSLTADEDICVSTDDEEIKAVVEQTGLPVPFLRPQELATDESGTYEVLLHALQFYKANGREYDLLVLLQPTSPFRKAEQIKEALNAWEPGLEMIVSVKETKANPYYVLYEENEKGLLMKSKQGNFTRRQDCPKVYELNGAIYVMDAASLLMCPLNTFTKIKKLLMDEISSLDIDTELDWKFASFLARQ